MIFEKCPKCDKDLHPPLKSSGRQVCVDCGWTYKLENKSQKDSLTDFISKPNQTTNKERAELINPNTTLFEKSSSSRKIYQFIQVRVQLLGQGMTNEIMNIYVNGKRLHPQQKTLHEFLNYLGFFGFKVIVNELETEGTYTHFFTLQREAYTEAIPNEDILDILNKAKEGANVGDTFRNFLELSLLNDNF